MGSKARKQVTQSVEVLAPLDGIRVSDQGIGPMSKGEGALYLDNLVPKDLGCTVRSGSKVWAINVPDADGPNGEIRTIIGYNDPTNLNNRLFAVTSSGIYDITAGGVGPHTEEVAWPNQGGLAGWTSHINHTTPSGESWLLMCDEANGYYQYDGTTWTAGTITGGIPLAENLVQITEWQNRIWFVERNSATAWYLPIAQIDGNPASIELGSRFLRGGNLIQLAVWTIDDGAGLNDRLLAISRGGDLLSFSGIDPDNADNFTMDGRWFVGSPPASRRVMSEWSGDVFIISSFGLLLASSVIAGNVSNEDDTVSHHIARYFRSQIRANGTFNGWASEFNGQEGLAIFNVPQADSDTSAWTQFVYNLVTKAWCAYKGLKMLCMIKLPQGFFFGTPDGRVMQHIGNVDDAPLLGSDAVAAPIQFSMLTHFRDFGMKGNWKRAQFIRPYFIGQSKPIFSVSCNYDYDLKYEGVYPPILDQGVSLWDTDLWGAASWGGGLEPSLFTYGGGYGMGRNVAVTMSGQASTAVSILRFDLMLETGGLL